MPSSSRRLALLAIVLLGLLVRLPFWLIALRTPVDGDTAIVGLMALHRSAGPTLWGQPYGSPLDAWVAWPFVALLGTTTLAVRLPGFLLSLALVPLAYLLARRLAEGAALPAAFLMACPPAYLVLLAALPPPFYPTTLVLLALLLWGALALGEALPARRPALGLFAWGAGAGLALWTHLMSAGVLGPCALWLLWRARGRRAALLLALLAALATSAPFWQRLARDPSAASMVSVAEEGQGPLRHALALLPKMHRPLLALIGVRAPVTADDPQNEVGLRWFGAAVLVSLYLTVLLAAAFAARHDPRALLLLACVLVPVAAFPWPLRAGPESVRFLTPAWLPLCVLSAWSAVDPRRTRRAWTVVLSLVVWQLLLVSQLLDEWRRPGTVLVPDCRPALKLLQERGLERAWASYNTAWCLTYTSGERVIASQPWNERFPGYPLPYLDELRFAPRAAWVLLPGADFDLPSAERFEQWLQASGGSARRTEAGGGALLFDDFVAPFGGRVHPLAGAGPAGDGDPGTRVLEPPAGAVSFRVEPPEPLAAVTLLGSGLPPGLPPGLIVEASADGVTFERVARLRESRGELMWANGHPQGRAGIDFVSIPLGGRTVAALRLTPAPARGPWALAELLLHPVGPDDAQALARRSSWAERRSVLKTRRPDRLEWYWQTRVASRNP